MKAEKQEARQLTDAERKRIREREEASFRELRLYLRDVINKLGRDRKFAMFAKPVDVTEVITRVLSGALIYSRQQEHNLVQIEAKIVS